MEAAGGRRELRPDRLLIPPHLVNRLGWSRGYFETLANVPLEEGEVLPIHCFEYGITHPCWYDQNHRPLPGPIPPVGSGGAGNWKTVEWEVFEALGLEQSTD